MQLVRIDHAQRISPECCKWMVAFKSQLSYREDYEKLTMEEYGQFERLVNSMMNHVIWLDNQN